MIVTENLPNDSQSTAPAGAGATLPFQQWNHTRLEYPHAKRVHELFAEQVERTPDAVAVIHEDRHLTYRQLNERAEALARVLRQCGVGPEVRVGLCALRSLEMVVGLYAILKAGGGYLPLDPSYPPERLAFMLQDAHVPVLLTQQVLQEVLPPTDARILWLDGAESSSTSDQGEPASKTRTTEGETAETTCVSSSENLAYLIYTSGSTGKPKGVMVRHRNVVNFFAGMDQVLGTEPGVWLAVTSISFDISVLELFWTLTRGFKVVLQGGEAEGARLRTSRQLQSRTDAARFTVAEQIRRHGVTHLQCTPSLAGLMLQDPPTREAFAQVRCFLLGGEPMPTALAEQLSANAALFNMYGPTETTVWSTCHRVTRTDGPIPLGQPLVNTQIYLLDPQFQPVPVGAEGELFIGGDGVSRGYLNRPELTAERFIPDRFSGQPEARLYRTGDLARYHADGTLEFLGRADQQVKLRGFRIELGEIEAAMRQCPSVQSSVVSVWESGPDNKRLVGYFVPQPGTNLEPVALKRFLKSKLPEYMVPSILTSVEAIPLTPNGKVDRKALPAPSGQHRGEPQVAPGAPASAGVGRDQSLAHSRREPEPKPAEAGAPGSARALPLTEAQREIWYAAQMSDGMSCAFNQSVTLRLRGDLDVDCLLGNLSRLAQRHEALRITFSGDGNVQRIHPAMAVPVPQSDLTALSAAARQEALRQALVEAATTPLDLAQGPLWRARLLRLGPQENMLLFTAHHLVCDGYSLHLLLSELGELYSTSDPPSPRLDRAPSFADFIREQEAARNSPERRSVEAYWLEQYSRPAPVLELPAARPHPARPTYAGGIRMLSLSPELSQQLKRLSARSRCSLGTTLLAGYYLLLHRLTGQPEIVVGLPMTGRTGEAGERLVGHCVNFLPLRLRVDRNGTFAEHLGQVHRLLLEAYEHQNFTLGTLLQKLNLRRSAGRLPLVSVMFNLDWAGSEVAFRGLTTEVAQNPYSGCRFDLVFNLAESAGHLELQCQYNAELFEAQAVQGWLELYRDLLASLALDPQQRLTDLPLLAEQMPPPQAEAAPPARALTTAVASLPMDSGRPGAAARSDAPLSPIEQQLAAIWREVLDLEQVGPADDFFDVGGHSLLATQVISRIANVFHVELPLRTVFETSTLGALAEAIGRAQREQPARATAIAPRSREAQASELLERLDQLSDAELQQLLQDPKLKDLLS